MRAVRSGPTYGVLAFLALVVAFVVFAKPFDGGPNGDDPLATTPVARAKRMADAKDLQVGLALGGRMSDSEEEIARSLDLAVRLKAKWIRTDIYWADIERSPGVYDWTPVDRMVDAAEQRDLQLLPILLGAPEWARRPGCAEKVTCPPADMNDFARFAAAATARYSPRGVHAWQIWNEPNIWLFWHRPDPELYASMFERAAQAIHAVDADATVVFGGLAALPPDLKVIEGRQFLREVCDQGVCDEMDALAYHPYTYPELASDPHVADPPWQRMADAGDSFVRILRQHGLRGVPIWVTEFGAPTGGRYDVSDGSRPLEPGVVDHVTEERQAQIAFDAVAMAVVTKRVKMLLWYTDVDLPERQGKQAYYGLLRDDGTPKPAWRRLKRAIRLFTRH